MTPPEVTTTVMTDAEIVEKLRAVVFDRPKVRIYPDTAFTLQVTPAELEAMEAAMRRLEGP